MFRTRKLRLKKTIKSYPNLLLLPSRVVIVLITEIVRDCINYRNSASPYLDSKVVTQAIRALKVRFLFSSRQDIFVC